jgi:hypothetical protein
VDPGTIRREVRGTDLLQSCKSLVLERSAVPWTRRQLKKSRMVRNNGCVLELLGLVSYCVSDLVFIWHPTPFHCTFLYSTCNCHPFSLYRVWVDPLRFNLPSLLTRMYMLTRSRPLAVGPEHRCPVGKRLQQVSQYRNARIAMSHSRSRDAGAWNESVDPKLLDCRRSPNPGTLSATKTLVLQCDALPEAVQRLYSAH